jgi:hypothetical protein
VSFFPVIELFDRLAIAEVKFKKTRANEQELIWYQRQVQDFDLTAVSNLYDDLKEIHQEIWALEAELKSGKEEELPLEEIGRRAIAIRNKNNKRIRIKNAMADLLGDSIQEIKKDHLSE